MTIAVQSTYDLFERDIERNGAFLKIEGRIKNPVSARSRGKSETLLSAYVALTCGRFESFLQEAFLAAANDLRSRIVSSSDARIIRHDRFHWTNITSFISWASNQGKRLDKVALESKIKAYATAVAAGEIFPESFHYTNANPKSDTVGDMFNRFGVDDPFAKLATVYKDSRGRTLNNNLLRTTLDSFVMRRHQAAHNGRVPGMTRSDAADDDVFIRAFAQAVVSVLRQHLAAIK